MVGVPRPLMTMTPKGPVIITDKLVTHNNDDDNDNNDNNDNNDINDHNDKNGDGSSKYKLNRKMGYLSTIDDAKNTLEKIYKNNSNLIIFVVFSTSF